MANGAAFYIFGDDSSVARVCAQGERVEKRDETRARVSLARVLSRASSHVSEKNEKAGGFRLWHGFADDNSEANTRCLDASSRESARFWT